MVNKKIVICTALLLALCGCSSSKKDEQSVANTSGAPVIEVKDATVTEGDKLKDSDVCTVKKEKGNKYSISITGYDKEKIGDQKIYVSVSDKNGNMTLRSAKVTVMEKASPTPSETPTPAPTPEPTPEATEEPKQTTPAAKPSNNGNNNSNKSNTTQRQQAQSQQPAQQQQQVQQPVQQPQSQPTQPQEDTNAGNANTGNPFGGNQASGATYSSYDACRLAKDGTNYSCIPVYGNDGTTVIGYN